MKKIVFIVALLMSGVGANAQSKGNAIGIRGVDAGHGGEISFQTGLGKSNRLELDLGFNSYSNSYSGLQLSGIYQWVWGLEQITDGLNWYVGVGGTAGSYSSGLGLAVVGQLGIEYNFNIPLQISLDWRPSFLNPNYSDGYYGNGLSVRYRF